MQEIGDSIQVCGAEADRAHGGRLGGAATVPMLDLARENGPIHNALRAAVAEVLESGRFVLGPQCEELERRIAERCRAAHAMGCASGSDALLLALMALETGPGDEVIVPSFTFFATVSAVWRLGARPVFVDIDPATFCLDAEAVAAAVTPRTKAIIPVHLFGQCADMLRIDSIARKEELFVIEDACQAIGAELDGRPAGSWGHVGCFSFYPTKNLGGCGDGGMLTTSDAALADTLQLLRTHGMRPRYHHQMVGLNSRLDTLQAALLLVKLAYFEEWTRRRQENARRYCALFGEMGLTERLTIPEERNGVHVWNQFAIRVPGGQRDALRAYLAARGVATEIYYPIPLHLQECFRELGVAAGSLPETERAAEEILNLPIFPGLTEQELATVVQRIHDFMVGERQ